MSRQQYIQDVCRSNLQDDSDFHKTRTMLYNQSYLIFQKLHQRAFPITVNKAAEEYGDALQEQIELVEQYYHELSLYKEREMFLQLSAIWKLCQIVYFSDQKDDINALMKWYNQINTSLYFEYNKQSIYFHPEGAFNHPNFWPYAIRIATLGYIDQLAALVKYVLLDVSLSGNNDILPYIIQLYDITTNMPLDKKKLQEAISNLNSTQWLHHKSKYHADQIHAVMSILLGDESITIQHTQDDIQAYICCRYYRHSVGSFMEFSNRNSSKLSNYASTSPSPNILRSIIAGDIYKAIEESVHYDWWLLAHLTDLLTMNQMIDRDIQVPAGKGFVSLPVKSNFILFYASFLKNRFGLWKQAYSYMLECGDFGKEAILEHLKNTNLNVEDNVLLEIVEFCNDHSLDSTGIELYKKKATMCMETNDFKNALYYYEKSKQDQCIDVVFSEIIWHLAMTGNWIDLASLGSTNYDGIYYTIYKHLQKFHHHIKSKELEDATDEFRELINIDSIPDDIIPVVIWEGLVLIKDPDMSFLKRSDVLLVKSKWQKLNKHATTQNFRLLYYYNKKDKSVVPEGEDELEIILKYQKQEFLDTTGLCFSRALDKINN